MTTKSLRSAGVSAKKIARVATVPEAFVSIVGNLVDLQENGFVVDLICSDGPYGKVLEKEYGFKIIYCDIPRGISIFRDIKSLWNLVKIFKANNYDIVHSHTPKAGLLSAIAGILSFRKVRLHTFTGQRWVTLQQPLKGILRLFDKLIVGMNTRCYADSPSQVEFLISENIGRASQIKCLGNGSFGGVDFEKFSPFGRDLVRAEISQRYRIPIEDPWCLFVGRVVRDKGINELIQAHGELLKLVSYQLVLIGSFEDELDPVTLKTKKIILSNPNIHFLGFQKEPSAYMRASDFLCLPSYREGFGSVVIESAACGIPSIGTNIPGLRDAIVGHETGLFVNKGDVGQLTDAMLYLIKNESSRRQLGSVALKRAREKFDYKTMSRLQIEEYEALLGG